MKTVELPGKFKRRQIKLYESIKELPLMRWHEFQKLALMDAGIGDSMDAFAGHFTLAYKLIGGGKMKEATQEIINLHNNFHYMLNGIGIKSTSFVALVHSIDGDLVTDLSMDNTQSILKQLSSDGLTLGHVEDIIDDVKKNLIRSFNPTFLTDSAGTATPTP